MTGPPAPDRSPPGRAARALRLAAGALAGLMLAGAPLARAAETPVPAATAAQEELEQTLERALQAASQRDFGAAVALLEPLLQLPNTPVPVVATLGALYLENGQADRALAVLRPLAAAENANPAVLYNAARAALASGLGAEGEGWLERSVALEPGTPAARELGVLRARQGRFADALLHLRGWVRDHPDDGDARLAAALAAIQLQRAPEAEEMLSDLPQDRPEVRLLWGKLLLLRGEQQAAIATLRPLLGSGAGGERDARRTMAEAHLQLGQAAEAAGLLEGRVDGDLAVALPLARARYQSGDVEGGLAVLDPFVAPRGDGDWSDPLGSRLARDYGRLLIAAGRHADALAHLERATRLRPDDKLGWQSLAQALTAAGRRDEARAALDRFQDLVNKEVPLAARQTQIERDVSDPAGMALTKALQLILKERYEEALELVREESRLSAEDVRLPLLEARILLLLGLPREALAAAERALGLEPDGADAHYQRGSVRIALRELDGAEADLRRALELSPEHTAAMSDLAVLLSSQGQVDEARRLLERILELNPEDGIAFRNLKMLEERSSG